MHWIGAEVQVGSEKFLAIWGENNMMQYTINLLSFNDTPRKCFVI